MAEMMFLLPILPVSFNDQEHRISQCNNAYIFPGLGLAHLSNKFKRISREMLMSAATTLADCAPTYDIQNEIGEHFLPLLPELSNIHQISKAIAFEVSKRAMQQKLAKKMSDEKLKAQIENKFWTPEYRSYRRYTI